MDTKQVFLDAIKKNPYDQTTRLIYSDWLLEQDEVEESDWQRSWTPERQQAEEFFIAFGQAATECDWEGNDAETVTKEQVLAAAKRWLETKQETTLSGQGFSITNNWTEERAKEFWMHYRNYTGTDVEVNENDDCPFGCCI